MVYINWGKSCSREQCSDTGTGSMAGKACHVYNTVVRYRQLSSR